MRQPSSPKGMSMWNTLPIIKNNGAPGGCGTCCQIEALENSPQSQNGTVDCTVIKYVISATTNEINAKILFINFLSITYHYIFIIKFFRITKLRLYNKIFVTFSENSRFLTIKRLKYPMLTHYYTLLKIVDELQLLIGCKLIECSSQNKDTLSFSFFDNEELHYLFFSGVPNFEAVYYTSNFYRKKINSVELFPKVLGEIVQEIELLPKTRIIRIKLIKHQIYFILFGGSKNNVIITNNHDMIVDSFSSSKDLIGTYFSQTEPNYFPLNSLPHEINILKALSYSELLLGKYYSLEFLKQISVIPNKIVGDFSENELKALNDKVRVFSNSILNSTVFYSLSDSENNSNQIFSLIKLCDFPIIHKSSNSPNELVRDILLQRIRKQNFNEKYNAFLRNAEQEFKRAKKQLVSLESEQLKRNLIEKYQLNAQLLYTSSNLKDKGMTEVKINDYEGIEIVIELNPKFSVMENAEKYYQKIKNLKKSLKVNQERKEKILQEYEISENRLKELSLIKDLTELKIHYRNHEKFYKSKMAKEEKEISERFKTFVLSEEATLFVGKDSKNNDELTFGFGKPNDYWFHLRGGSGSHCILKYTGKGNPPKEIIQKSASISAYYSSQRNGGFVPVAYTQKKYVRKPKGAHPGAVVIAKEEVILVEPKIEF
jgi:predicted ribosome quality control (RQC) complex YloA/Tae2 family protein